MKFQIGQDLIDTLRGKKKIIFIDKFKEYGVKQVVKNEFYCDFLNANNALNFLPSGRIRVCCYGLYDEVLDIYKTDFYNDFDGIIKRIKDKRIQMAKLFKNKQTLPVPCKNCFYIKKGDSVIYRGSVNRVFFNHYMFCNLRCVHCGYVKYLGTIKDVNHEYVLKAVKYLDKMGYLDKDIRFVVGGGEPSLSKGIQEIIRYCVEHNYSTNISTNCAQYIEFWAQGVKKGLITLFLTPDAGSKEVYRAIKGADYFDIAWDNIGKYINTTSKGVIVKFILEKRNLHDIENMVNKCVEYKVREVTIAKDLGFHRKDYNELIEPIRFFRELLENNRISYNDSLIPKEIWDNKYKEDR
ncbi:MAG: radical SAM protein [Elusimicrobiota bacterium]|jgi:sulfatase maturation enzyme AslB (radical SAM superfamily)|nr:radical SAM protein [Elusimicrobiota bacterium]